MKHVEMDANLRSKVVEALRRAPLFHGLSQDQVAQVVDMAELVTFEDDEVMVRQGQPSDSVYLMLTGEASVRLASESEDAEIGVIRPPETFGEIGTLLEHARTANVVATGEVTAVRFPREAFVSMFTRVPYFGLVTSRALAVRLARANLHVPLPHHENAELPEPGVLRMLPVAFMERHRVLPLASDGTTLTLGCIGDPGTNVLHGARQLLPGMDIRPVRIDSSLFEKVMKARASVAALDESATTMPITVTSPESRAPDLDELLKRVVAEGASDLHLSAGQRPHWRLDGLMHPLEGARVLGPDEARTLLDPVMSDRHRAQFDELNDTDFAYSVPGLARFRINMFRDNRGVGAVLRLIPETILSFEQLGLPKAVQELCTMPSGLILVTGPTGSGKSTTIASMISWIVQQRAWHVITLEDPIEYLHPSAKALVNQREVGPHTRSFAAALRAALREDPNVLLVGEMRDAETMELALEAAATGHLVFATTHTSTAATTVDRIISTFVGNEQEQARILLAESLRGIVCQTLCRKIGGGRVAALEVLIGTRAAQNLLREGKTHQIENVMVTGRKEGHLLLNESLERLWRARRIDRDEALAKAIDKDDMKQRMKPPAQDATQSAG